MNTGWVIMCDGEYIDENEELTSFIENAYVYYDYNVADYNACNLVALYDDVKIVSV